MKPILGALAGGVAGNALFALITRWIPFVEGQAWWWSMAGVFLVSGAIAYVVMSRTEKTEPKAPAGTASVGSGLASDEAMDVKVGAVTVAGKNDVQVLSGNKSKGPMNLTAGDVDIT